MKTTLILFFSFMLITAFSFVAYNSDKGPARGTEGITELPVRTTDSVLARGKYLVSKMNYSDRDLQAISLYLANR